MEHFEQLLKLFRAYSEGDQNGFQRAADAIIADELMANHPENARDLKRAIQQSGPKKRSPPRKAMMQLSQIKERSTGQSFIQFSRKSVSTDTICLVPEVQKQLDRVITEQLHRTKLQKNGLEPKSRILFWGPPGCGKTLASHYLATTLELPLGVIKLSSVISSFLGETASNLERVFEAASARPMVLLLDEADSLLKERADNNDVGELKRIVNGLLQIIDSFPTSKSVFIAATNHQDLIDEAAWRRFDEVIHFPLPDQASIIPFIQQQLRPLQLKGTLKEVSRNSQGLSFAQIEHVVRDTVKLAILMDRKEVLAQDLLNSMKNFRLRVQHATKRDSKD